jgi:hypothetical protein
VYRADVTSIVSGNGNYIISGLPVTTQLTNANDDTDGGTLLIMYQDLTSSFTGSIHLMDGCVPILGGIANQTMNNINSCGNSTSGSAFIGVADLQIAGSTYSLNGSPTNTYSGFNWMDFLSTSTTVTNGQTTASYTFQSSGDCYCLFLGGLYWQTACLTCNPSTAGLTVTSTSITPATCGSNGGASVAVSGGSGNYSITWYTNPNQYGNTATNISGGSYLVSVIDSIAGMCGNALITIPYTGPVVTASSTPVNCQNNGTATASVSGGTSPYTYSWSPSGGNAATASNLPAGSYVVSVTDATGCTVSASVTVVNVSNLAVVVSVVPDSCPSPSGAATAAVTGGQPPYSYTWMPGNLTTSTISGVPSGTYTLTITDGAGCVINTNVVIPYNNSSSQVSVTGGGTIGCGAFVQLNASVPSGNATYSWSPSTYLSANNIANPYCNPFSSITYTVTAVSACGTSTAVVTVQVSSINSVSENICVVSVDTSINRNVVVWQHSQSPTYGYYNIYRETAVAGVYAVLATQPASVFTTYTDYTSTPWSVAQRYKVSYVDSCGTESAQSSHHRTCFLQVSPAVPSGYNLIWTAYEGLNVQTYNVYRGPNNSNMTLIAQVPSSTLNYTDPNPPAGTIFYVVEAVHPNGGCSPSFNLMSGPQVQTVSPNSGLSNFWASTGVGIAENALHSSLTVSPNPGNGEFVLNCNLSAGDDVEVSITDVAGRVVYTYVQSANGTTFRLDMDLSPLAAGIYNVKVTNGANEGVTKLVIAQ